jgi:5'-3' exonuclease
MSKTFQQVQEQENTLMVVDALNLAFRWKHSGSTDFYEEYLSTINSLKKSYKAQWVIVAADQGSSSYRKQIFPEYKQNRKDKFAEQTELEQAAFEKFFEDYQASLDWIRNKTNYPVIQFKQTEADDIAAYIAGVVSKYSVDHTWLISSDKDWDLLVSDKVSRFSYVTRKEVTANNWHTHYEFPQESYISIKCLMGDSGDGVPGVEGIGPKRATLLVEEYGTALDIVANLPIESKLKYIKTLNEQGDRILLNYQLMDLVTFCRDALGENTKQIDETLNNYIV